MNACIGSFNANKPVGQAFTLLQNTLDVPTTLVTVLPQDSWAEDMLACYDSVSVSVIVTCVTHVSLDISKVKKKQRDDVYQRLCSWE